MFCSSSRLGGPPGADSSGGGSVATKQAGRALQGLPERPDAAEHSPLRLRRRYRAPGGAGDAGSHSR